MASASRANSSCPRTARRSSGRNQQMTLRILRTSVLHLTLLEREADSNRVRISGPTSASTCSCSSLRSPLLFQILTLVLVSSPRVHRVSLTRPTALPNRYRGHLCALRAIRHYNRSDQQPYFQVRHLIPSGGAMLNQSRVQLEYFPSRLVAWDSVRDVGPGD